MLTSIAPHLTDQPLEQRDARAPVFLSGLITVLLIAVAYLKGGGRGYAAALLFGLLTATLLVLNLVRSDRD